MPDHPYPYEKMAGTVPICLEGLTDAQLDCLREALAKKDASGLAKFGLNEHQIDAIQRRFAFVVAPFLSHYDLSWCPRNRAKHTHVGVQW